MGYISTISGKESLENFMIKLILTLETDRVILWDFTTLSTIVLNAIIIHNRE